VSDDLSLKDKSDKIIIVEDVLTTLQQLANYHRKELAIPIIGITGSNGKTTTKELIREVLMQKYIVKATIGNYNNHIGVPLTLLSFDDKVEIGIVEMGANHPGEIKTLCEIAEPDYGIITNIGTAHIEGFGSYEGVKRTKAELYDYIKIKNGGLFINGEDEVLLGLAEDYDTVFYYGNHEYSSCIGNITKSDPFLDVEWNSKEEQTKKHKISSHLIGSYNFSNVMAAIAFGIFYCVEPEDINQALELYEPSNNRSQFIEKVNNRIILDAYNANPSSMTKALENFIGMKAEKKTIVLGDMLELGEVSNEEHENICKILDNASFKQVFLVGKEFQKTLNRDSWNYYDTSDDLALFLEKYPLIDQLILIKGSRGIRLEKLLDCIG
jgi:UDP-N-acetylmuramoyl-tripeptide--D-alanyl-D-alanine ligase